MKSSLSQPLCWLIAFAVAAAAAWFLVLPMHQRILPQMLRTGTEQMIAQWRDAMLAYKADHGSFPPGDLASMKEESWINALHRQNKLEKLYIDKYSIRTRHVVPVDGWDNALFFDYDGTGDLSNIRSAGPDGKFGTGDDIVSRDCPQRNIPVPEDLLDQSARRKKDAEKKKDEAEAAEKDPPTGPTPAADPPKSAAP